MRVTPLGKAASRTVRADQSVLLYTKCVGRYDMAGALITASTVTPGANALTFTTNGAVDTDIAAGGLVTYAAVGTIQGAVDLINGIGAAVANTRYRASLGDYRPGYVIGAGDGLVAAAQNILLGEDVDGYAALADISGHAVANTFSVCLGGPRARRGTDMRLPDHFETGYTSTTAGVITKVREAKRSREIWGDAMLQVHITSIHFGAAFGNNDKAIAVYDINDNLIWDYVLAAANDVPANVLDEDHPIKGPMGSPLFVEGAGTGGLTDGPLSVRGYIKIA